MAVLTIGGTGTSVTFLAAQAQEGGFLYQQPEVVEERLTTPGVSGTRWRTMGTQFPPAVVLAVAEAADYGSAVSLAASYLPLVGSLVTVTWTPGGGVPITYKNVHIAKVDAVPVAGVPVGGGASGSSTAHVRAMWTLEATEFQKGTTGA